VKVNSSLYAPGIKIHAQNALRYGATPEQIALTAFL